MDIAAAVDQLNRLLPLKRQQDALASPLRALHRDILRGFAEAGVPPTRAQIAATPGLGDVDAALSRLAGADLIVLAADRATITGAYPFTVEPRVHRVQQVNGQAVHAMCALDALAIAPLFGTGTRIDSRCHVSGQPITIHRQDARVTEVRPADPRVGIRWQGTAGCAAQSLCLEMVFLQDRATAEAWRQTDPDNISLFDLPGTVRCGAAYFRPLLA
ncbi:MAG: alkylmercury lyase family protein [Gammaproteobacteria bacterium]